MAASVSDRVVTGSPNPGTMRDSSSSLNWPSSISAAVSSASESCWKALASAATTTPRSRGSGVGDGGEVRDLAQRADGVEGGNEPPQAALVTDSARNEEQQAVLYFR